MTDERLDRAMLTAVAATQLDPGPDTIAGLIETLQRAPFAMDIARLADGDRPLAIAIDSSAVNLVVIGNGGTGEVLDAETLERKASLTGPHGLGAGLPSRRTIRHRGGRRPRGARVRVVDASDPEVELIVFAGPDGSAGPPQSIDVTPDGQTIAAVFPLETGGSAVLVWDVDEPATPLFEHEVPSFVYAARLSPDGEQLFEVTEEQITRVDVRSGGDPGRCTRLGGGEHQSRRHAGRGSPRPGCRGH